VPGASLVHGATFDADGSRERPAPTRARAGAGGHAGRYRWDTDRRFPDDLAAYAVEELGSCRGEP